MKYRVMLLLTALPFLSSPLYPESAEGPPEGVLWSSLSLSAFSPAPAADAEPQGLQFAALGFSLEYGVLPWASLSARWDPGIFFSGSAASRSGSFSDILLALRLGLIGPRGLIKLDPLRLALTTGVNSPLPSETHSVWEPASHLWGAYLGLAADYIPVPWFHVSTSASALFNPEQASRNPAFSRETVNHPLDLRVELEPRFSRLNPNGVIFSIPLIYEHAPESEVRGRALGDEGRLVYLGCGYTIALRDAPWPFQTTLRFLVPLDGINRTGLYRIEVSGAVAIPLK